MDESQDQGPSSPRQPTSIYTRVDWDRAVAEGTLSPRDVLDRLARIAIHEFGDEGPAGYDEDGFFVSLTAEGLRLEAA